MKKGKLSQIGLLTIALALVVDATGTNRFDLNKSTRKLEDQVSEESIDQGSVFQNQFRNPGFGSMFVSSPNAFYTSRNNFYATFANQSPATQYGPSYYETILAQTGPISCNVPKVNPEQCKFMKYRSFDGSCNNIHNPILGMANTPFSRLAPPNYADGIYIPNLSILKKPLPNARVISISIFPDLNVQDNKLTLAAMQWGQFMTHDMALAAGSALNEQMSAMCCSQDGRTITEEGLTAKHCYPILVPKNDPLATKYQQACISFARTMTDKDVGCSSDHKPAEQLVEVSHFLDASTVYGSNLQTAMGLRTFEGGQLAMEYRKGQYWPPSNLNRTSVCPVRSTLVESCYLAGDLRINQNTQLTVLHIILLREHNRVAKELSILNPHWKDETLYQEARKIVIAEVQQISYYEWLPLFLGWKNLQNYGVIHNQQKKLHINDYSEFTDPRVINEHSTAAFRAFHTNIQGYLKMVTEDRKSNGAVRLSDHYNNPSVLEYGDNFNDLARGMVTQPQQASDQFHSVEITDYLFRDGQPFGLDLKAIDVQRGRDHGLPSYNTMREHCGSTRAKTFEDFLDYISPENVRRLMKYYDHPEDVDLNVGGLLENLIPGTLSGPTYMCIMLEQFYRTRTGDRFFFENAQHKGAFTPEQLIEVRKTSLARLLCDNGHKIYSMQPKAFLKVSDSNPLLSCEDTHSIPSINFEPWIEHSGYTHYLYKK